MVTAAGGTVFWMTRSWLLCIPFALVAPVLAAFIVFWMDTIRLADPDRIPGVMEALAKRQVRISRRGQSIRVSPHVYNAPTDMDALMDGLVAGLR